MSTYLNLLRYNIVCTKTILLSMLCSIKPKNLFKRGSCKSKKELKVNIVGTLLSKIRPLHCLDQSSGMSLSGQQLIGWDVVVSPIYENKAFTTVVEHVMAIFNPYFAGSEPVLSKQRQGATSTELSRTVWTFDRSL